MATLYDRHFQKCVVAFLLRDSTFLNIVKQDLRPDFFTDQYLQRLVRIVFQFYDDNKAAPGILIIRELEKLSGDGKLSAQVNELLAKVLLELFSIELQNRDYLLKEVSSFIRFSKIESKFPELAELSKQCKFEDAAKLAKEMFFNGHSKLQGGRLFDLDTAVRIRRRLQGDKTKLWTMLPEIDQYVEGLSPGEIGVLQSQKSSIGKTAALVQFARNFMAQKKKVAFYSLEESEDAIEDRMDQCVAGLSRENLIDGSKIERRLKYFWNRGALWIKKFPDATTRVSDLRDYTQVLKSAHNFYPDVVIIDYACLLAPETKSLVGDLYGAGFEVYNHWREWMVEEELVGWTGMQSNRSGAFADVADQEHTGGSLSKVQRADVVISLNRGKKDYANSTTTLHIVKNRRGRAGVDVLIKNSFETMNFRTS